MSKPLTHKQQRIRDFVAQCIEQRSLHPTVREIARHFGKSLGAIQDHIAALEAKGALRRERGRARGISLTGMSPTSAGKYLPVLGQVPAGTPIEAIEHADDAIHLDQALAGKADYLLRVKGDSMEPEICPGDLVLVRQAVTANDGEIIVARFSDDDATLKRLRRNGLTAWLEAANPKYPPIEEHFEVAGKVIGLVRRYGRH